MVAGRNGNSVAALLIPVKRTGPWASYTKTQKPRLMYPTWCGAGHVENVSQIKHLDGHHRRTQRCRWVSDNTNWYYCIGDRKGLKTRHHQWRRDQRPPTRRLGCHARSTTFGWAVPSIRKIPSRLISAAVIDLRLPLFEWSRRHPAARTARAPSF